MRVVQNDSSSKRFVKRDVGMENEGNENDTVQARVEKDICTCTWPEVSWRACVRLGQGNNISSCSVWALDERDISSSEIMKLCR